MTSKFLIISFVDIETDNSTYNILVISIPVYRDDIFSSDGEGKFNQYPADKLYTIITHGLPLESITHVSVIGSRAY